MQLIHIRPINPASATELACVAQWIRETLIEVEGEETGTALYSMDWLLERVRWHLDASQVKATVLLAQNQDQMLL